MGTNVITQRSTPNVVTLTELQDLETACALCRFERHSFSPMMVTELTRPMTPLNVVESLESLSIIDLLAAGTTAAAPLRASKQVFNTVFLSCLELPFTEVVLTPQISYSQPWIVSAVKKLSHIQHWAPNWNDAGAVGFSAETVDTAYDILRKVWDFAARREIRTKPNIVPLEDGSIRFEWVNGNKELFLTVLGKSVEAQKWHPLDAVESDGYQVLAPSFVDHELEWLAA